MKVFVSGSCRVLVGFGSTHKQIVSIHSIYPTGGIKGHNFLGKLHNIKQHIQFIKFIKNEINIPKNILPKLFTSFNYRLPWGTYSDDMSLLQNKINNLNKYFNNCEWYIFEICSLKIYINQTYYVHHELTNEYEIEYQTEEDLYNDLQIIRNMIPKNKKILFQTHFRPNIIYNDKSKSIDNREIIYNVVNNFCNQNKNTYIFDPSIILNKNKNLFDGNTHYTLKGCKYNYEYICDNIINPKQINNKKYNNIKYNYHLINKN